MQIGVLYYAAHACNLKVANTKIRRVFIVTSWGVQRSSWSMPERGFGGVADPYFVTSRVVFIRRMLRVLWKTRKWLHGWFLLLFLFPWSLGIFNGSGVCREVFRCVSRQCLSTSLNLPISTTQLDHQASIHFLSLRLMPIINHGNKYFLRSFSISITHMFPYINAMMLSLSTNIWLCHNLISHDSTRFKNKRLHMFHSNWYKTCQT